MVDATEVVVAGSPAEAVDAFGDGDGVTVVAGSPGGAGDAFGEGEGVTVVGGGPFVRPEFAPGRLAPRRALLIPRAGLAGIRRDGGRLTIGAATTLAELEDAPEPLGTCAR